MSLPSASRYWTRSVTTRDFDVVDVVLGRRARGPGAVIVAERIIDDVAGRRRPSPSSGGSSGGTGDSSGPGLVDLHRIAVEVRVGEQRGGPLEVHDGEEELVVVLVDARAAADDLLELGHRLDALVEHDQLAGLRIDAGGHQLRGRGDDRDRWTPGR